MTSLLDRPRLVTEGEFESEWNSTACKQDEGGVARFQLITLLVSCRGNAE